MTGESENSRNTFVVSRNQKFMERDGPARSEGRTCSQRKLCFTATDKEALARLLHELSERADCYYVKHSIEPRDGMYLGRCFLTTDEAVGRAWAELKTHPKFFTSVQDDDFTEPFRRMIS